MMKNILYKIRSLLNKLYWNLWKKFRIGTRRKQLGIFLSRIKGKKIVHVLHIGKTGGTALRKILEENIGHCDVHFVCWWHNTLLSEIPSGDGILFFVRDPVSRYISGFDARQREGKPSYFSPHSPDEERAFKYFKTPDDLATALTSSNSKLSDEAIRAMNSIWHVDRLQVDSVISLEYLRNRIDDIYYIGRQETFENDVKNILKIAGVKIRNFKIDLDPVVANRRPDSKGIISSNGQENIEHWYFRDIEFIDYCETKRIAMGWCSA